MNIEQNGKEKHYKIKWVVIQINTHKLDHTTKTIRVI